MQTARCSFAIHFIYALAVYTAAPASAGPLTTSKVEVVKEQMKLLMQADAQLVEQMYYVAKRLRLFYEKNGRFPADGTEMEDFKSRVLKHLLFNPYKPHVKDEYANEERKEDEKTHLYIATDSGITLDAAKSYRLAPPPTWQADPGTIMVVLNGEGTYWIWGASADRLPVRDPLTNKTRLFARNLKAEWQHRQDVAAEQTRQRELLEIYGPQM